MTFRMVLVHPQIPPNTGSIARTCAATQTPLHLVKPIGFDLSDKALRRAGIDYWPHVDLTVHENLAAFEAAKGPGRLLAFSPRGTVHFQQFSYQPGDWLVHGAELEGLPESVLQWADHLLYIPILAEGVRSLNLASAASVSLYEALRA